MDNKHEHQHWGFLYRKLGKLKEVTKTYNVLIEHIELKNNRYNPLFQLILDSFTHYICNDIYKFFDKSKKAYSLFKYNTLDRKELDRIKSKYDQYIHLRNNITAHLSGDIVHTNNFIFLSKNGIIEINNAIDEIEKLLVEINIKGEYNEGYVLEWIGLDTSLTNFIYDLKK